MTKRICHIVALGLLALLVGSMPASAQKTKNEKQPKEEKLPKPGLSDKDYVKSAKTNKTIDDVPTASPEDFDSDRTLLPATLNTDTLKKSSVVVRGDTVFIDETFPVDTVKRDAVDVYNIHLLTRGYKDRVVLRWAPQDYATWRMLNRYGYRIIRVDFNHEGPRVDTICTRLMPLSVEQFRQKYPPEDSIAGIAVETMYGTPTSSTQPKNQRGTLGNLIEQYDEQQSYFSLGMMAAEMNLGVAHDMALAYTDRNVVEGCTYFYRLEALVPEHIMYINPAGNNVEVKPYRPEPYSVEFSDSINPPALISLMWPRDAYYAHDIERRQLSDTTATATATEWERLNDHPYVYLSTDQQTEDAGEIFLDRGVRQGIYEYRLRGYDTFGDLTLPSNVHRVVMLDLVPPRAPSIELFEILRPDDKILAKVKWQKDTVEADFTGFRVLYYNKNVFDEWHQLGDDLPASATETTVDVTDLPTGLVCVAALDSAGNMGPSVPQTMRIMDMVPPSVPQNLRANVAPDGLIVLRWSPSPERDVDYYELQYSNELAEGFTYLNTVHQDTLFADSVSVTVNQRFVYYRVRAIDYATNASDFSEPIEVLRPHFQPPLVNRLDTAWVDNSSQVTMRWIQSNEADLAYSRLFRRLETSDTWELLAVFNADSVRFYGNDFITYVDKPAPNINDDYIYVMDTWNLSNFSSGLSRQHHFSVTGPRFIRIKLQLSGSFDPKTGETRIAWETGKVPDYGPYYYCIYRRGEGDDDFVYLTSVDNDLNWSDVLLREAGQKADYYVKLRYDDGRESNPSNIVTVTRPAN